MPSMILMMRGGGGQKVWKPDDVILERTLSRTNKPRSPWQLRWAWVALSLLELIATKLQTLNFIRQTLTKQDWVAFMSQPYWVEVKVELSLRLRLRLRVSWGWVEVRLRLRLRGYFWLFGAPLAKPTMSTPPKLRLNSIWTKLRLNLISTWASNQSQPQYQLNLNLNSIWLWHKSNLVSDLF